MPNRALDHNIQFSFHFVIGQVQTDAIPVPIPDIFEHPKEDAPAVDFVLDPFDLYVTVIMDFIVTKQREIISNKNVVFTMQLEDVQEIESRAQF